MITRKHTLIVAFAICAVALLALGASQEYVERPFNIEGNVTVTIDLTNGHMTSVDWGEATHCGRYLNQGTGYTSPGHLFQTGSAVCANGDQLFWQQQDNQIVFTGGTGRFENIKGGFEYVQFDTVPTQPDPNTRILTFKYHGVGTVSY
jgi:hypothetical protein